eukprot:CAMPEP_0202895624 /NCGR_PEP_ID=MMETSP1392-20130828/4772_1 /ASSEMBLY_ACC=CAM_ASM_000868 /TAXON_ID=225041 /ORGANISM="Chlamydomonas chlamydogama, Strain SAG 11-48b" /LENGTH=479 /DNA_ID=CAMNT_0049580687 /DNA_START=152 /DNA_END=1588 /DNA_ORIENTATION=-
MDDSRQGTTTQDASIRPLKLKFENAYIAQLAERAAGLWENLSIDDAVAAADGCNIASPTGGTPSPSQSNSSPTSMTVPARSRTHTNRALTTSISFGLRESTELQEAFRLTSDSQTTLGALANRTKGLDCPSTIADDTVSEGSECDRLPSLGEPISSQVLQEARLQASDLTCSNTEADTTNSHTDTNDSLNDSQVVPALYEQHAEKPARSTEEPDGPGKPSPSAGAVARRRLLRSSGVDLPEQDSPSPFSFKMREKIAAAEADNRSTSPTMWSSRPSSFTTSCAASDDGGSTRSSPAGLAAQEAVKAIQQEEQEAAAQAQQQAAPRPIRLEALVVPDYPPPSGSREGSPRVPTPSTGTPSKTHGSSSRHHAPPSRRRMPQTVMAVFVPSGERYDEADAQMKAHAKAYARAKNMSYEEALAYLLAKKGKRAAGALKETASMPGSHSSSPAKQKPSPNVQHNSDPTTGTRGPTSLRMASYEW